MDPLVSDVFDIDQGSRKVIPKRKGSRLGDLVSHMWLNALGQMKFKL